MADGSLPQMIGHSKPPALSVRGKTEFASDCELDNSGSLAFHLKMGFAEANRIICFHKTLED